jgi:hypothetical protein
MTVKELKEKLANAPDDMEVMVEVPNHLKPGMFAFAPACSCDTGVTTLGASEDGTCGGENVFLVLPHGSGVPEDEIDNEKNRSPELN